MISRRAADRRFWSFVLDHRRSTRSARTTFPVARFTRRAASHDVVDLLGIDGFVLHQRVRHGVELVAVIRQDLLGRAIALVNDAAHFRVDQLGRLTREAGVLTAAATTQEYLLVFLGIHQRTQFLGQAPLGDHVPGNLAGTHDVVGSAGGDTVKAQGNLFSDTAAVQRADLADQRTLGQAVAILFRQEHGHTQRTTARDDRDLVDRVVLGHHTTDNGVTGLVIRGVLFFLLGHDHGFALGTHHDLVFRQLEFLHLDDALAGARGEQGSLVHQVGQVGTGEARRTPCNHPGCDVVAHRHLAHMHFENLLATADIRQADHDLTVEATRTQQRRVEYVRTVSGGNHDDAIVHLETVHLHQQLVESLFTLVVTTAHAGTTVTTDRIDFVDEDDARRVLLRLL